MSTLPGSSLPVFSMAGGKWTTFRAFAEETADARARRARRAAHRVTTEDLPIGGGRDYPLDALRSSAWLERLAASTRPAP